VRALSLTPPPPAHISSSPQNWCADHAGAWSTKCTWNSTECGGCDVCATVVNDTSARCENWCSDHAKPWSTKCAWANGQCAGCDKCDLTPSPPPATPPPNPPSSPPPDYCQCNGNGNQMSCDVSGDRYCGTGQECYATTKVLYGEWDSMCAADVCECTGNGNQMSCSASGDRYCGTGEECYAKTKVPYGQWDGICQTTG